MAHAFRFPTSSKTTVLIRSEEDTRSINMSPDSEAFGICEQSENRVGTLYMIILTCGTGGYAVTTRHCSVQNVDDVIIAYKSSGL
jgi:hypothetical protein